MCFGKGPAQQPLFCLPTAINLRYAPQAETDCDAESCGEIYAYIVYINTSRHVSCLSSKLGNSWTEPAISRSIPKEPLVGDTVY